MSALANAVRTDFSGEYRERAWSRGVLYAGGAGVSAGAADRMMLGPP